MPKWAERARQYRLIYPLPRGYFLRFPSSNLQGKQPLIGEDADIPFSYLARLSRMPLQFYVIPEANLWHLHARHSRVCARTYVYDANIIAQG